MQCVLFFRRVKRVRPLRPGNFTCRCRKQSQVMTITARPTANRIPPFVSDERVDMKAGLLFDALSKYVPSLDGPSKAKYLSWASKHGGKVSVEYSDPGIGRFDIRVKGLKDGETMYTQAFPGDHGNLFKSSICDKYYRDCDISNCHPVLLSQLCVAEGIATPVLDRYIQQRAAVIAECGLQITLTFLACKRFIIP